MNGSTTLTLVFRKSRVLRVTTVRSWCRAVAAIMLSSTGNVRPFLLNSTTNRGIREHGGRGLAAAESSCRR